MSIKEKVNKEIENISNAMSNENEKNEVMKSIKNIVDVFSENLARVVKKQSETDERVEEVFEMLSQIEDELLENLAEDFEAECPYCGEKVPLRFPENDDEKDIECPKCHNIIELDLMLDGASCDCGCGCEDCHEEGSCDCGCEDCSEDGCCDCGCENCDCNEKDDEKE